MANERSQPAVPRPAATVILLREAGEGVEVLVIRRHEKLAFMGGMWVFPGGVVCPADAAPDALARIPPSSQAGCARFASLQGDPLDAHACLALTVAACRETFEETGLLLAHDATGKQAGNDVAARLQNRRQAIAAQPDLFAEMLRAEDLFLRVEHLVYWAHWITPSVVSRRFDTRFFIASVPPDQCAVIDSTETVDHAWMRPSALIAAAEAGTMPVAHPTLYNLMELDTNLQHCGSLQALLAAEANRSVVTILPKMVHAEQTAMVLPWDPAYPDFAGEGAPEREYPAPLRALPPRILLKR